jgi:phosphate transport system permease protein
LATIARPQLPEASSSRKTRLDDGLFRMLTFSAAAFVLFLVFLIVWQLVVGGAPALRAEGLEFFTSSVWDVPRNQFGALAFVWGTFVSSMIALLIGGTVGVAIAAFLVELAPSWMLKPVGFLVDLLAAIPSIIYGLWGVFVLIPWLRTTLYPQMADGFGWTGLFGSQGGALPGTGLFTAGLVLAVMIIPTVAAITREVLLVVPKNMRDGALALGANRTEALKTVQMPYASGGILGALILGLGRALGETMAVAMVIGNSAMIHLDLLRPGASLASNIANEFGEARELQRSALIGLGLVLFVVTFALNVLARALVARIRKRSGLQ